MGRYVAPNYTKNLKIFANALSRTRLHFSQSNPLWIRLRLGGNKCLEGQKLEFFVIFQVIVNFCQQQAIFKIISIKQFCRAGSQLHFVWSFGFLKNVGLFRKIVCHLAWHAILPWLAIYSQNFKFWHFVPLWRFVPL